MAQARRSTAEMWTLIHEVREKVAGELAVLLPEQWDAASLCAGWRVRDVAAHCVETNRRTRTSSLAQYLMSGFRFNTMAAKDVARHKSDTTDELLAQYRESMSGTNAPPEPKVTILGEAVIHAEDMFRPIGRRVEPPPAALAATLAYARASTLLLHGKQRSAGLRLRATDIDWTSGDGPDVSGPAASLILAITGRPAGLADLGGEGLETLRSRLS